MYVCVCEYRPVKRTLSVEGGCVVRWVCGSAACVCARQWDRKETTVTLWATRWDHLLRDSHMSTQQQCIVFITKVQRFSDPEVWLYLCLSPHSNLGSQECDFAFCVITFKAPRPSPSNSHKCPVKQPPSACTVPEENETNLIPKVSLSPPPGSFLWEKTPPYVPLSAQPVMCHHRGGDIQMSFTIQVSRLLPLRTNTYSYTICYLHCNYL